MRTAIVVLLLLVTTTVHAETWYRGRYGKNRIVHLSIAVGGSILHIATGPAEGRLSADACRWCDPTGLDKATREALVWNDRNLAKTLSNADAYGAVPAFSVSLVLAGMVADPSTAAVFDDLTPILEATMIASWVTRILKLGTARQRPYAHYTGPIDEEDNLSFPSGHTSTSFAVAISAAYVARMRGYRSEHYLWIGGTVLAAGAGYLRIAGDRHYLTDVLSGAVLGTGVGLTVPLLMNREVSVVPTHDGIALVGAW
ncbi:MAG TPA: phosphatase PAP2 family protein [Kofleriaceae bacterium]|nr:phosphatase PAP2 family protein [Kofleriaceae bacterium]